MAAWSSEQLSTGLSRESPKRAASSAAAALAQAAQTLRRRRPTSTSQSSPRPAFPLPWHAAPSWHAARSIHSSVRTLRDGQTPLYRMLYRPPTNSPLEHHQQRRAANTRARAAPQGLHNKCAGTRPLASTRRPCSRSPRSRPPAVPFPACMAKEMSIGMRQTADT